MSELYETKIRLGVVKMKYPKEVIASKHVRLRKETKKKLALLEFHTLRGITHFSVRSFCKYIEIVTGKDAFSVVEMGDIIRALRNKSTRFEGKNSFFPHFLPADVIAAFWKRDIRTHCELSSMSRFEVVQMLVTSGTGNIGPRTEDIEDLLKYKNLSLCTDKNSLDHLVHSNKVMRRAIIELYIQGIRTVEDAANISGRPEYYLGKRKKPKPAERKAEIKERLLVYCYHVHKQQQKTKTRLE